MRNKVTLDVAIDLTNACVESGRRPAWRVYDGSMVDFFRMVKKGEQIGKVTSARYSPRPEKSIGYRNGPIEHSEVGTELEVKTPSEGTPLRWSPSSS